MSEFIAIAEPEPQTRNPQVTAPAMPPSKAILFVYAATVFLSAFLLFQVQLLIGKYILPLFGGTPAVWNTCMFCFQILLLLGYGYAHRVGAINNPRAQGRVHGALLAISAAILIVLWAMWGSPLIPGTSWRPGPGDNPVWKILELVGATVALPFLVLSTTGPLLQKWFSQSYASPYRLYALSNAGSLLGLVSYPFLVEWAFDLKHQAYLWSAGYGVFTLLCALIAWRTAVQSNASPSAPIEKTVLQGKAGGPSRAHYLLWLGLSTCSTTVLLATTNLLCQDLAVIPLLWVLPLGIYLLSFIITFDSNRWYRRSVFWPLYFLVLGLGAGPDFLGYNPVALPYALAVCGLSVLAVSMVCHGELARSKPASAHLTSFYFMVAGGGALGGAFVVLIAPHLFKGFFEFQTGLIACGLLLFMAFLLEDPTGRAERPLWQLALAIALGFFLSYLTQLFPNLGKATFLDRQYFTVPLCVGILLILQLFRRHQENDSVDQEKSGFPWQPVAALLALGVFAILAYGYSQAASVHILFQERNFFGVKRVVKVPAADASEEMVLLVSANTVHGAEFTALPRRDVPTTYYGTASGIGLLLNNYPRGAGGNGNLRIGLIGMGAGTLAAYSRPGDLLRFYEIDPAVIQLSTGPVRYFHFLEDSRAQMEIVPGDARLSLEKEASQQQSQKFDVLVVDAFTGDSIPVHLLTAEAMKIYRKHLRSQDSVLAFNVSNKYLDFRPVLVGLAGHSGFTAVRVKSQLSEWILLSANPEILRLPNLVEKAAPITLKGQPVLWTDSYSNLFQVWSVPGH